MATPYFYDLPEERIAQRPCHPAHAAKLLVIDRKAASLHQSTFWEISDFFSEQDLLIFNNTKVVPARLFGKITSRGDAECELLLVQLLPDPGHPLARTYRCLGRPLKKMGAGTTLLFGEHLQAEVVKREGEFEVIVRFTVPGAKELLWVVAAIEKAGTMPIPPYIRRGHADEQDLRDYQTIFAKKRGSIAAPTASLHFTPELMDKLAGKGVAQDTVTLHVGTASFQPVYRDGPGGPVTTPGVERMECSGELIGKMEGVRERGGKVVAVGTTTVRALESALAGKTRVTPEGNLTGDTDLFITPGFSFKAASAVVTNFHQPGTTHLLLVEALLGPELLARAYQYALQNDFRFLSYGDGMLIL